MGAKFTICCCHYYLKHNREEKNAILCMRATAASTQPVLLSSESSDSDAEEESLFGLQPSRRRPRNNQPSQRSTVDRWAYTNRPCESPIRRGSDRELQAFISMRDQADQATELHLEKDLLHFLMARGFWKFLIEQYQEEWEKLNYDIHTLRYARREVRSRWKKILLLLGYQCEVDSLLCVNRQNRFSRDQEHLNKATELLKQLLDHTSLFPPETEHQNTYLCVMDRLVSLDSAEDFVRLAKEKYPKRVG